MKIGITAAVMAFLAVCVLSASGEASPLMRMGKNQNGILLRIDQACQLANDQKCRKKANKESSCLSEGAGPSAGYARERCQENARCTCLMKKCGDQSCN